MGVTVGPPGRQCVQEEVVGLLGRRPRVHPCAALFVVHLLEQGAVGTAEIEVETA